MLVCCPRKGTSTVAMSGVLQQPASSNKAGEMVHKNLGMIPLSSRFPKLLNGQFTSNLSLAKVQTSIRVCVIGDAKALAVYSHLTCVSRLDINLYYHVCFINTTAQ